MLNLSREGMGRREGGRGAVEGGGWMGGGDYLLSRPRGWKRAGWDEPPSALHVALCIRYLLAKSWIMTLNSLQRSMESTLHPEILANRESKSMHGQFFFIGEDSYPSIVCIEYYTLNKLQLSFDGTGEKSKSCSMTPILHEMTQNLRRVFPTTFASFYK